MNQKSIEVKGGIKERWGLIFSCYVDDYFDIGLENSWSLWGFGVNPSWIGFSGERFHPR